MRSDLALQTLNLRARVGNLDVDLVQRTTFLRDFLFAAVDLSPRVLLGLGKPFDFGATSSEFSLKRFELFARIMCIEHTQICVQRLIAARFAGLPLQRTDLAFHFFYHVADTKKI